jgi:hypothetical protein
VDPRDYYHDVIKQTLEWLVMIYMLSDTLVMLDTRWHVYENAMEHYSRPLNWEDELQTIMRINLN